MAAKYLLRSLLCSVSILGSGLAFAMLPAACSDSKDESPGGPDGSVSDGPVASTLCADLKLPVKSFAGAPYGKHRGEVANDFTLTQIDGTSWNFKQSFTGCETYIFVPDSLTFSSVKTTSIWTKDLSTLVAASPKNAHYFFVSTKGADAAADASTQAMQGRVDDFLGTLSDQDAAHWRAHLHVIAGRAGTYGNWIGDELKGIGNLGFAIDREQQIRGLGNLADVSRSGGDSNWPWDANLAFAANEALYMNSQAEIRARLDAEKATEVTLWGGEVLDQGFAEKDVTLPFADDMAKFDTLEIEVTQTCPDPESNEFANNCGAWDYLAYLFVFPEGATPGTDGGVGDNNRDPRFVELGRFITSYHRETHWVVDATPMLVLLKNGDTRHFRWEWAPSWNKQPTGTKVTLRFSNQNKGYKPTDLVPLYQWVQGRRFNSEYDVGLEPKEVPIAPDAKKVELWTIVTGHGQDKNQCAEFCNHEHEFTINGEQHTLKFPDTGGTKESQDKCIPHQTNGMVPNQAGTWWFGRGGWCPGQQVDPWTVDVTANVKSNGKATVSYRGLFNDAPPTIPPVEPLPDGGMPEDKTGNILLDSYLVVYR